MGEHIRKTRSPGWVLVEERAQWGITLSTPMETSLRTEVNKVLVHLPGGHLRKTRSSGWVLVEEGSFSSTGTYNGT